MKVSREQARRYRWQVQGLDADAGSLAVPDVAILDIGVQSGAQDAARSSLVDRGVSIDEAVDVTTGFGDEVALVWAVRGAPHFYRRADVPDVARALSPFDAADAYKRLAGTGGMWKKTGVDPLAALTEIGRDMHDRLATPRGKGDLSAAMHGEIPAEYETDCRPCGATHPAEMAFRLAPLFAGIELEPGTSPPVLRRLPELDGVRPAGPVNPAEAPERLSVVRTYLHFCGPATPADVAAYLDSTVRAVRPHWPEDVVEVDLAGRRAWLLADDVPALEEAAHTERGTVRLLSPFDLFTAARDRALLVDAAHHTQVWPVLGRPGTVARDGEILGIWRPTTTGKKLTVRIELWGGTDARLETELEARAELLAAVRGRRPAGVETL